MSHRVFGPRRATWALALVCMGPFAGCGNLTRPESETLVQSAVTVPPVTQFFILARRGVTMGDRATESGGSIGVIYGCTVIAFCAEPRKRRTCALSGAFAATMARQRA